MQPADAAKARVFDEIIASKNDNDPRLDRDFNAMSEGFKHLLRQRYEGLPPENRNERGTAVFLLGRNLTTPDDFGFLERVLRESPCLSLADCGRADGSPRSAEDLHLEAGHAVTLAYPQLVALKAIESYLFGASRDPARTAAALRDLETAQGSRIEKVSVMAEAIARRYAAKSGGRDGS